MTLSIKKLDRMCLIVVVIVSVICGSWVVSRGVKQQRQIRQENDLLSKRLNDLNLADTNLQRLKTALDATRKELQALNERIPDSANIGEFLKQIDSLMKERRIVLIGLWPLPTVKERLYIRIPVRLMFKGSFINVYHLLHDIETMNRTLVMEKILITKSDIAQECQVNLVANVFER
jgi:Tfp pilus assembly protein PilO